MDTNLLLLQASDAVQLAQNGQTRNTIILGVIGLVGSAISTFGAILLARIAASSKTTAIAAETTAQTAKATDGKTAVLLEKTDQIHVLTNSNLSKVTAALEVQIAKNTEQEKMIVSLNGRITEYEKQNVVLSPANISPVTQEVKSAVREAVIDSVKAPVKEAVQESFTRSELEAFVRALKK